MGLRPSVHGTDSSSQRKANHHRDIHNDSRSSTVSMQSDTANDKSDPPTSASASLPPVQRQAWTARGQLLLNFHDVISRAINSPEMIKKCSEIAADMSENEHVASTVDQRTDQSGVSNSLAKDYSAEANLIIENKSRRDAEVRNKTISVGLCVFGMLRGGRGVRSWMKTAVANRSAALSRYRFDSLPSKLGPGANTSKIRPHEPQQSLEPTKLRRFLRLAVDITISTTIALISGEFLFIPRPSSYIEDMSKLPLVEGKSLYAEIVCPPLLKEYKRVLEQYGQWPVMSANSTKNDNAVDGKPVLTQEDVSLNIIRKFAENCSKRSKYERALLEERHALGKHHDQHSGVELTHRMSKRKFSNDHKEESIKLGAVMVPSGGVPEELFVDIDTDVLSLEDTTDVQSAK
ncbi:hypothetical protein HJC23_012342 [Cyclotella cryptica]|uniref:Uncharacterized protein n=1 Tax=Cyclotella cryptica TaxID=29204 RepID=A0ABD3QEW9_9STRA|eukprot:CCRYP_006536-RA/>CCRYP_006536-RA protein AED:0.00 eAED:0.00 QI:246/-1/1/1/-1/1/1/58/403